MRDDSHEYFRRLLEDARTVEIRHNRGGKWESGLFDDLGHLSAAIRNHSREGNLYTTLNRPAGRIATNAFGVQALRDDDIATICRIVFDFDPKRPTNTPSVDEELQSAIKASELAVRMLTAHGWPTPALGLSGNGAHAVYRTRIENSPAWRQRAAALYAGLRGRLQSRFGELGVEFDVTVRNPARIWRLYGSTNRKGDATVERPHRVASITLPAGPWQIVKAATIERTVAALTPVVEQHRQQIERARGPVTGGGDYSTLDIVGWFAAHDAYRRPLVNGKHAVRCPWVGDHSTAPPPNGSDTVVWEAINRWPSFHCSHAHCADRNLRDVIALWGDGGRFCSREWSRSNG